MNSFNALRKQAAEKGFKGSPNPTRTQLEAFLISHQRKGKTFQGGYLEEVIAGDYGTARAGDCSTAIAGDYGTASVGCNGTARAGDGGTALAGAEGKAFAGISGTATAGFKGSATVGLRGIASSGNEGIASADGGGLLSIAWWDKDARRQRIMVAYVGEDGIEPNVAYKLDVNGKFIKA